MIVLRTKVEVAKQDGGLRTGDNEDDEDEEEEAVHVVDLTAPNAVEDEKELDEGKHSAHDNTGDGLSVDRLVWNLPGNLVCSDWLLYSRLSEPEVSSDKRERHRNPEPQSE